MTACCVDPITSTTVTQKTTENDDDAGHNTLAKGKSENINFLIYGLSRTYFSVGLNMRW